MELWVTINTSHSGNKCISQTIKRRLNGNDTLFNSTHHVQLAPLRIFSPFSVTSKHPYMVQMHFETVTQSKYSIALNHVSEYGPDHMRFKLVPATQSNANHFILYVVSTAYSQTQQVSIRHVIDNVICESSNAIL